MSDREKRLLFFLLAVGFLVVNAGAFKLFYQPNLKKAQDTEQQMVNRRKQAEIDLADQEFRRDEIDWLLKADRENTSQKALADLEQRASREATKRGLTLRGRKPLVAVMHPTLFYHRARVEIEVSGPEEFIYRWLDQLNVPSDLRAATMIRMNPKRDDPYQVECLVVLEQWFVPKGKSVPDA